MIDPRLTTQASPTRKNRLVVPILFSFLVTGIFTSVNSYTTRPVTQTMQQQSQFSNRPSFGATSVSSNHQTQEEQSHSVCDLPGDPSLILTTNVDLGNAKMDVMKALSKAVAERTGKPESYVAISITDKASMIFGGSDAPLALGCLYSIGSIAKESNGAITSAVTDALEPFGVAADRIYINCFDVPRANCGWNRQTFAG